MKPQEAIDILEKMIAILEVRDRTRCLCGAYTYATNPDIPKEERLVWTANESVLNELGLFRPKDSFNLPPGSFWFRMGDVDIRIKLCKEAIEKWKEQL